MFSLVSLNKLLCNLLPSKITYIVNVVNLWVKQFQYTCSCVNIPEGALANKAHHLLVDSPTDSPEKTINYTLLKSGLYGKAHETHQTCGGRCFGQSRTCPST